DALQFLIPPTFQLGRHETVPRINRVVLFKRFLRLVLQLLEFAGQGGVLSRVLSAQFLNRLQAGFESERGDDFHQFLAHPAIDRCAAETNAILSAIVIVSLADVSRMGSAPAPVTYMKLAAHAAP